MSKLIEELTEEHKQLSTIFNTIISSGLTSDKGLRLVTQSKELLLNHLKKEDDRLYPPLRKLAKTNPYINNTLNYYEQELASVTSFALNFYNKYTNIKSLNKKEFIEDLSSINIAFKNRVIKEEILLYKFYEKLGID